MLALHNQLLIVARVVEMSGLRYTPAGLPVLDILLEHESTQHEHKQARQVRLLLSGLAFGWIAESLVKQAIGQTLRFSGFLAQGRSKKSLKLHIQAFEPIAGNEATNQTNSETQPNAKLDV